MSSERTSATRNNFDAVNKWTRGKRKRISFDQRVRFTKSTSSTTNKRHHGRERIDFNVILRNETVKLTTTRAEQCLPADGVNRREETDRQIERERTKGEDTHIGHKDLIVQWTLNAQALEERRA